MKKWLYLILLISSLAQAKEINDDQLSAEQIQAVHQETISQFKNDFQVVLDNYNNYVDHNEEQKGLTNCKSELNNKLKDDFSHYNWNTYQKIDFEKIPLKIQTTTKTLVDLAKEDSSFSYYSYGKIFVIESKNESLLNDISSQLFPYFLNTQLVKDQNFYNHTYLIKFVMLKTMSASEYNQMTNLINQQTTAALQCTNQYINHGSNDLYNKFFNSFKDFTKRYQPVFNELLNNHELDDTITLHVINDATINSEPLYYDGSMIKLYKNDKGYIAQLNYHQAIMFLARNIRYSSSMEDNVYNTQQSIVEKSKQAKNEVDSLF
jgi:hypothetical protein